jgi:hypothetical protein
MRIISVTIQESIYCLMYRVTDRFLVFVLTKHSGVMTQAIRAVGISDFPCRVLRAPLQIPEPLLVLTNTQSSFGLFHIWIKRKAAVFGEPKFVLR